MVEFISIGVLVIALGVGYGIRSREVGAKAAARDLLYGILGIAAVIVVLVGLRLLRVPLRPNGISIIMLTGLGIAMIYLIIFLRRKKEAGSLLLDIGPSAQRKLFLIAGGFFLLASISDLIDVFERGSKTRINDVASCLFFLSFGVLFILWGRSHFELREGGILCLDRFIKWQQIKSYEWGGTKKLTLTLRFSRRFPFYRAPRSLRIPAHQKETAEKLLGRYLQLDKDIP
jgi:hypothetical protein